MALSDEQQAAFDAMIEQDRCIEFEGLFIKPDNILPHYNQIRVTGRSLRIGVEPIVTIAHRRDIPAAIVKKWCAT